jgi:hypothetical protein
VLRYNLARLALLAGCLGVGALAGLRSIALIVVALLVSGVLSYFLLAKWRIEMAAAIETTVTRTRSRLAARTAAEDAYVDALLDANSDGARQSAAEPTSRP